MTVKELRQSLFEIEEQDKEITLADIEKIMKEWVLTQELKKYENALRKIDPLALLNHPLKEQLKNCTDLAEKVKLLEKIVSDKK